MNKKGNAIAALFVLVLIAIIFIGMYSVIRPTAMVEEKLTQNPYENYTQTQCNGRGYWESGQCEALPQRARDLIVSSRKRWLVAPFIFVVSLLIWFIMVCVRRDTRIERIVIGKGGLRPK